MRTKYEKKHYYRGYSSGYNAGRDNRWPQHRPPLPPKGMVADMYEAADNLRGWVESHFSQLDEEDDWYIDSKPHLDRLHDEFEKLSEWLQSPEDAEGSRA